MRHLFTILALSLLLLAGCHRKATRTDLLQAEQLADTLPAQTLAILDTIDSSTLSGHDLFLHRFLTIKARDKEFITHTSDSLLLLALDYARSHRSSVNYPEMLYYAGRVYTDMGDYPTALDYYYSSLDEIPENQDLKLRAKVLSNLGYIHISTCLYREGINAFKEAICLDSICGDTLNMVYDLISLGNIYFKLNEYTNSENISRKVVSIATTKYPNIKAEQQLNIARIKLYTNNVDSAIILLSNTANEVEPLLRPHAYSIAAEIYYHAGVLDSAYYYAHKVIESNSQQNATKAYSLMLSRGMIELFSKDSIHNFARKLVESANGSIKRNSEKAILIQNSQYNYSLQQREKIKAENKVSTIYKIFWISTATLLSCVLFAFVIILNLKLRAQQQRLKIAVFQRDISFLKNELLNLSSKAINIVDDEIGDRRAKLKQELIDRLLPEISDTRILLQRDKLIGSSEPYRELCMRLRTEQPFNPNDSVWDSLKNVILEASPNFFYNLELLLGHPLSDIELYTAMLVKCHFSPTEIAIILKRTKGTISYRREDMGRSMFGKKVSVKTVDMVIKIL